MTTYTLTAEQLNEVVELLVTSLHHIPTTEQELMKDTNNAIHMLRGLQPNTQEPCAWANMKDDGTAALLSISQHPEDRERWMNPVPLYTHPAPQQTQEHRKDTVFGGPKAREQMLNQLVHPEPQKPQELTNDDLWAVWDSYYTDVASYERQSFDVAFLRAVLEAAHGVKP